MGSGVPSDLCPLLSALFEAKGGGNVNVVNDVKVYVNVPIARNPNVYAGC